MFKWIRKTSTLPPFVARLTGVGVNGAHVALGRCYRDSIRLPNVDRRAPLSSKKKTGAGSSRSRCHWVVEPTDALRRRLAFGFASLRGDGRDSEVIGSDQSSEFEGWNTSSGGTFSPNVRTTRAILRLRVSARLSSTGVVGVGGTSNERGERVADGVHVSADDWGTELRRMRGRGLTPGCRDLIASINGTVDSSASVEESEVLRSDSLEDEEAWEGSNGGKLSELVLASSKIVNCRWR